MPLGVERWAVSHAIGLLATLASLRLTGTHPFLSPNLILNCGTQAYRRLLQFPAAMPT
ncbi:MAG: hypothetical protein H7237_01465 [Alkalinema sp. FL-bin-369]|nr:hypothetical protein [Leptolyngbyaceae cyanobacterium LF-bin-369]